MIEKDKVIEVLKECYDPELRIDVYTLGLIYNIDIQGEDVNIRMTFTTPVCPYGPMLLENMKEKLGDAGIKNVKIDVVFSPPWKASDELRSMLGL